LLLRESFGFVAAFVLFFLFSCGIEDTPFIGSVPPSYISRQNVYRATIWLPSPSSDFGSEFTNFEIYYKIYLSDMPVTSIDASNMASVNAALASDYNALYTYTADNTSSTVLQTFSTTIFTGRGFYPIDLSRLSIENYVLSPSYPSVLGKSVVIEFPNSSTEVPYLMRSDIDDDHTAPDYNPDHLPLQRRISQIGTETPYSTSTDKHLFLNFPELHQTPGTTNSNRDVSSTLQGTGIQYAYCLLYIVAVGINDSTLSSLSGIPTYINVFLLPNR
jgi:hypothetical protein